VGSGFEPQAPHSRKCVRPAYFRRAPARDIGTGRPAFVFLPSGFLEAFVGSRTPILRPLRGERSGLQSGLGAGGAAGIYAPGGRHGGDDLFDPAGHQGDEAAVVCAVGRLDEITGVGRDAAHAVIASASAGRRAWPSSGQLQDRIGCRRHAGQLRQPHRIELVVFGRPGVRQRLACPPLGKQPWYGVRHPAARGDRRVSRRETSGCSFAWPPPRLGIRGTWPLSGYMYVRKAWRKASISPR
jgi:hypothetical protein